EGNLACVILLSCGEQDGWRPCPVPRRTTACSRLPEASARPSPPLPAAAEARRSACVPRRRKMYTVVVFLPVPLTFMASSKKGWPMQFGLFYQLPCAPEQQEVTRYHDTIEQIMYADELGFDIAWLAELHFYRPFSILSSPLILATALAQRTTRIRLGTA